MTSGEKGKLQSASFYARPIRWPENHAWPGPILDFSPGRALKPGGQRQVGHLGLSLKHLELLQRQRFTWCLPDGLLPKYCYL